MLNFTDIPTSPAAQIRIDSDLDTRFQLYTIFGFIVLVVSSITVFVFSSTKEFRTKYALFNALAIADFVNGLSFVMAGIYRSKFMHEGKYFVPVTNAECIWETPWAVLMIVAGQLPAFLNLGLSLERLVALQFSSWYRRNWKEAYKHLIVFACVFITGILFVFVLFLDKIYTVHNGDRICAVMNSTGIIFGTIHYSVCALIFLICYAMLVVIFSRTNKSKKPSKDERRRQLMLQTITLVSVVLVSIPNLALILNEWKSPAMNALLVGILYCLYATHSALSLPIYLYFRPDFRRRFMSLFLRKNVVMDGTTTIHVSKAETR